MQVGVCAATNLCLVSHSKEEALKEIERLKEANRVTVDKLMEKAKQTAEENTNTRAEVEANTKASKEEVARLHSMISQQRKMVEEQKKMIARLTSARATGGTGGAAAVNGAAGTPSPAANPKKRTADDAKIPAHSPPPAGDGSAEKKARVAIASPAAATQLPAGGGAPNPLLAFLTRKEKAGQLTPQQKDQLEALRYDTSLHVVAHTHMLRARHLHAAIDMLFNCDSAVLVCLSANSATAVAERWTSGWCARLQDATAERLCGVRRRDSCISMNV